MTTNIEVGLIGFSQRELDKFKKIFEVSKARDRSYFIKEVKNNESSDLIIINKDSESLLQKDTYQSEHPKVPIITAGKSPESESSHHIQGVLIASRVLKILDEVPLIHKSTIEPLNESIDTEESNFYDVLVVDDSEVMQKTLELELLKSPVPLNVDFADNGEKALEKIATKKYDFIFLDIMMPGIDGFETCTRIRKMASMKKTPIIMLTSKASPLDEVKGVISGCTTYLTKPYDHDDFQKMLERIMRWLKEFNENKKLES